MVIIIKLQGHYDFQSFYEIRQEISPTLTDFEYVCVNLENFLPTFIGFGLLMIYYTFGSNSTLLYGPEFSEAAGNSHHEGAKPRGSFMDIYYDGEQMGRASSTLEKGLLFGPAPRLSGSFFKKQ